MLPRWQDCGFDTTAVVEIPLSSLYARSIKVGLEVFAGAFLRVCFKLL